MEEWKNLPLDPSCFLRTLPSVLGGTARVSKSVPAFTRVFFSEISAWAVSVSEGTHVFSTGSFLG